MESFGIELCHSEQASEFSKSPDTAKPAASDFGPYAVWTVSGHSRDMLNNAQRPFSLPYALQAQEGYLLVNQTHARRVRICT